VALVGGLDQITSDILLFDDELDAILSAYTALHNSAVIIKKNSLYKIVQKIEIYFKYINMLRLI